MHIVYVGYPGFPVGHAQVERQKLLARGLVACGCEVTVLSRYGVLSQSKGANINPSGLYEEVRYCFTSGIAYRPDSFLLRNYYKLKGLVNEARLLWKLRSEKKLDAVIITTNSFYNVLFYSLLAYVCQAQSILDNVEYWGQRQGSGLLQRIDHYLYDNHAFRFTTKVICISNYLLDIVLKQAPQKPVLKVPVIVDLAKFYTNGNLREPYFLFCGSASYFDTIRLIIEAYELLGNTTYKLYIVSSGPKHLLDRVKQRIAQSTYQGSIQLFSELKYDDLILLYTSSKALLIPLMNSEQDKARFPHKIGEYCASSKTIITTKVGEIKYYFKDKYNALIAEKATPKCFAEKMNFIINNPELGEVLGERSFAVAKQHFDHLKLGRKVYKFISQQEEVKTPIPYQVQTIYY
ncbi:glycosyltransferase family 4 protein [Pontibacter oryzae]|nr:glycosyltransferase family 4 protein [Pontibacter oryzae]